MFVAALTVLELASLSLAMHSVVLDWQAGELELLQDFCEDLQNGFGGAFQCERLALRVIEQSQV